MANKGKYIIGIRLLLLKDFLQANADRDRIITRRQIEEYISQFPVQTVGASYHQELWIPSEELSEFNRHIIGKIEIV